MTKSTAAVLLYQRDFSNKDQDRYFLLEDEAFSEKSAHEIVDLKFTIVTHDYWCIAPALYSKTGKLPKSVIDICELAKFIAGRRLDQPMVKQTSIRGIIDPLYTNKESLSSYFRQYNRQEEIDLDVFLEFSKKLLISLSRLKKEAEERGELTRFREIELPVFNILTRSTCRGIKLDGLALQSHKNAINSEFYHSLKDFCSEFNLIYEVPRGEDLRDILLKKGCDLSANSADFYINFVPMEDNFGVKLKDLLKVSNSRTVLSDIPSRSKRVYPLLDPHSTITSRVYFRNPLIQNLAKKYRNIFISDKNLVLTYVDYDQFEIGIMAALSGDEMMMKIYRDQDIYSKFSEEVFGSDQKRKLSKMMFLSFTYGMEPKRLMEATQKHGGSISAAKKFFSQFHAFIEWRKKVANEFEAEGRISTLHGNYLNRTQIGQLSKKEMRSCVSQVVQGTGSLIFKKALIKLSKIPRVQILIPMHDAALVQHPPQLNKQTLIDAFESAMSETLSGDFKAKASIESFYA